MTDTLRKGGRPDPKEGTIHLDVLANKGCDEGTVLFQLRERPGEDIYLMADDVLDMKDAKKKFSIFYHLDDDSGLGLRFHKNKADALWVQQGDCPKAVCHDHEFKVVGVSPDRLRLEVKNENTLAQTYGYALRFEDRDGRAVDFDPIVINNGGGNFELC